MKRVLRDVGLLMCAILCISITTYGQYTNDDDDRNDVRVGFKGGLNLSNLYVNDVDDENVRVGWHAGFYTQLFQSQVFTIQPEVNFSTKGSGITYVQGLTGNRYDQRFNLSYIDIPVLAVFKLGKAAEIHAGPYWSYLVHAEIKNNEGDPNNEFDTQDRNNFDKWDYGLVGGIGFNLGEGAQLGVRYNYGLNEIARSPGMKRVFGNAKNQVAQLYLALNLNAKDDPDGYDNNRNGY
jgi:hypothetical protein